MLNKQDIFPIGIGTWGIGGYMEKDSSINEPKQVKALKYMIDKGCNFIEVNHWYSQGYSVDILAKALKQSTVSRENVFICQAIYAKESDLSSVEDEVDMVCKKLGTDYIDTLQFTSSVFYRFGFDNAVKAVNHLLEKGKVRYTSITNENLSLLKQYHQAFKEKLFSHEVCINFEIRANEIEGTPKYAKKNGIATVVYQPLRRNRTAARSWPLLVKLAKKYKVTQNQILLAWHRSNGYISLTKSETISHIDEHLDSMKVKLKTEDITALNTFSPPNYHSPLIDWEVTGRGVSVDQLSNLFDENYDRENNA